MTHRILCVGLVGVLCLMFQSGTDGQQKSPVDAFANLKSPENQTRRDAASIILENRRDTINRLLKIADQEKDEGVLDRTKELAISLLGEYRAIEAVPFLVKNVNYRVLALGQIDDGLSRYPCARALRKIGAAAYPVIWRRFREPIKDEEDIALFAQIVRLVDGEEIGQARIELARKDAENIGPPDGPVMRKNLDRLLEHYKTKKKGF